MSSAVECFEVGADELREFAIKNTLPYYASIVQSTDFIASLGGVPATASR